MKSVIAALIFLLCSSRAFADPAKGSPINVFNGPVAASATEVTSNPIDMNQYCRASLDIVRTNTFAGVLAVEGTALDVKRALWWPEPVPGQKVDDNGRASGVPLAPKVSSTQAQTQLIHLSFVVAHPTLRLRLGNIVSGQNGGTLEAILTPQPC